AGADRRSFLSRFGVAAAAVAVSGRGLARGATGFSPSKALTASVTTGTLPDGKAAADGAITDRTIAQAAKLSGLHLSEEQRKPLIAATQAQVADLEAMRKVSFPRETQPALIFDPRLPGHTYPAQTNSVRLAPADAPPLPKDDTDIAYAPVTWLSHW